MRFRGNCAAGPEVLEKLLGVQSLRLIGGQGWRAIYLDNNSAGSNSCSTRPALQLGRVGFSGRFLEFPSLLVKFLPCGAAVTEGLREL